MLTATAPLRAVATLVLMVLALAACAGSSLAVTSSPARPTLTSSSTAQMTYVGFRPPQAAGLSPLR
jgi:hypothetical protein